MVNESLNINNVVTYEKYKQFDTIVIRRVDGTTNTINLTELQVWVNDTNIMYPNADILTGYFANWSAKDTEINPFRHGSLTFPDGSVSRIYDNLITFDYEAHSAGDTNAMIIKDNSLTFLDDIQSVVLYNRTGTQQERAVGLIMEFYNSIDNPDLTEVLANTNEISVADAIYRFDFPSLSTYSDSNSFATGNSTTLITSNATIEDAIINDIDTDVYINSNVIIQAR